MAGNHGYQTPEKGEADWHIPLNGNFEQLDSDVEIRDSESNLSSYEPKRGAKFLATDTGTRFYGTGNEWRELPVQDHSHEDGLTLPVTTSDPSEATVGNIWYRSDSDRLKIQTLDGIKTASFTAVTGGTATSSDADVQIAFDDSSYGDEFTNTYYESRTSIADFGPTNSNSSLRVEIPEGEHYGTGLGYGFESEGFSEPEELHARYYLYIGDGFETDGDGKLPGPAGRYDTEGWGGRSATGGGWSARGLFHDRNSNGDVPIGYYCYHMGYDGSYGDHMMWDHTLTPGQWYRIDQWISLNDPGTANGELKAWVDGELSFDRQGLEFRDSLDVKIEEYWFNIYYGGSTPSPAANDLYFDDLQISLGERL